MRTGTGIRKPSGTSLWRTRRLRVTPSAAGVTVVLQRYEGMAVRSIHWSKNQLQSPGA
jgi:hypothetical protein